MPIREGFHSRGYLPHIKIEGRPYFVTFRLADSLPKEVVLRMKEEREDAIRRAEIEGNDEAKQRVRRLSADQVLQIDACLDRSLGASWLRSPNVASLVAGALNHFRDERYQLPAWCVMPNHVHAVVRPLGFHSLESVLHSWKSFTANAAHRELNLARRSFWQRESYDHWIRSDDDFVRCCHYTEENPVKAGLCAKASDWPWSSAGFQPAALRSDRRK